MVSLTAFVAWLHILARESRSRADQGNNSDAFVVLVRSAVKR